MHHRVARSRAIADLRSTNRSAPIRALGDDVVGVARVEHVTETTADDNGPSPRGDGSRCRDDVRGATIGSLTWCAYVERPLTLRRRRASANCLLFDLGPLQPRLSCLKRGKRPLK